MSIKLFLAFVMILGAGTGPLYAQANKEEATAHYIKGNEYYIQGKYKEAEEEFTLALRLLSQREEGGPPAEAGAKETAFEPPAERGKGEYVIDLEDGLYISAWQNLLAETGSEYTIDKDDTLFISVWQNPDLTQEVTVRPDGMISFPLVGDLEAKGLTIPKLREQLAEKLKEFIRYPDVSVAIRRLGGIKELAQEVTVRPDGKISLPMVGDIQAKGLTVSQLKDELRAGLKSYIRYADVTVMIKKLGGAKVIVLGEVEEPGVYSVSGAKNILEAIGLAGGFTADAVPASTVLIRKVFAEQPEAQRVNLARSLKGDVREAVPSLVSEDVIFVPKKFIANLNYFLSQVIEPLAKGAYISKELQGW